jgi:hypothetical protein
MSSIQVTTRKASKSAMSEFEKDSAFKQSEDQRALDLAKWKISTEPYDHKELAENFANLDPHDMQSGKGVSIPPVTHMAAVKKEDLKRLEDLLTEIKDLFRNEHWDTELVDEALEIVQAS